MNAADYVILATLAISLVFGVIRGFMREALGLLAWLGGLWLAWRYAHWVTPMLGGMLGEEPQRTWVARGIIVLMVLLIGWLLSAILSYFIHQSGLTLLLDRLLGGFFGTLRGAVLVALTVMLAQLVQLDQVNWWKESRLIPHAVTVSQWISGFAESALDSDSLKSKA